MILKRSIWDPAIIDIVLSQSHVPCPFLQAADEGEYQCVAESEAGKAERTITLKVQSEFCLYTYTHFNRL